MAHRIDIRTPCTNPDDSIGGFESHLTESIALLQEYNELLERQKAIEIQMDQSKEATISALVKKLVEQRQQQSVVRKCIGTLFKIKDEFEAVKQIIVSKSGPSVLVANQSTQCDLSTSSSVVMVSTGTFMEDEEVANSSALLPRLKIIEKKTDGAPFGGSQPKEGATNGSKASSHSRDLERLAGTKSPSKKDNFNAKTVRFSTENPTVLPTSTENFSPEKRVPLQTTQINMFHQIIPARAFENIDSANLNKVEATLTATNVRVASSIREKLMAKLQTPSPGKPSRQDLQKIYSIENFRSVKRSNLSGSGSVTIQNSVNLEPSHKLQEKLITAMETSKYQKPDNYCRHQVNENVDDFAPYDILIPNPKNRQARVALGENLCNAERTEFQKTLSTTLKQQRKATCKTPKKKVNEQKKKHDKREELSSNGKRLVQTEIPFEHKPINEIYEFSTSTSDVESMIQEESKVDLQTGGVKIDSDSASSKDEQMN